MNKIQNVLIKVLASYGQIWVFIGDIYTTLQVAVFAFPVTKYRNLRGLSVFNNLKSRDMYF